MPIILESISSAKGRSCVLPPRVLSLYMFKTIDLLKHGYLYGILGSKPIVFVDIFVQIGISSKRFLPMSSLSPCATFAWIFRKVLERLNFDRYWTIWIFQGLDAEYKQHKKDMTHILLYHFLCYCMHRAHSGLLDNKTMIHGCCLTQILWSNKSLKWLPKPE